MGALFSKTIISSFRNISSPMSDSSVSNSSPMSDGSVSNSSPMSDGSVSNSSPMSDGSVSNSSPMSDGSVSNSSPMSDGSVSNSYPMNDSSVSNSYPMSNGSVSDSYPMSNDSVSAKEKEYIIYLLRSFITCETLHSSAPIFGIYNLERKSGYRDGFYCNDIHHCYPDCKHFLYTYTIKITNIVTAQCIEFPGVNEHLICDHSDVSYEVVKKIRSIIDHDNYENFDTPIVSKQTLWLSKRFANGSTSSYSQRIFIDIMTHISLKTIKFPTNHVGFLFPRVLDVYGFYEKILDIQCQKLIELNMICKKSTPYDIEYFYAQYEHIRMIINDSISNLTWFDLVEIEHKKDAIWAIEEITYGINKTGIPREVISIRSRMKSDMQVISQYRNTGLYTNCYWLIIHPSNKFDFDKKLIICEKDNIELFASLLPEWFKQETIDCFGVNLK